MFYPRVKTYRRRHRGPLALEHLETRLAPASFVWSGGGGVGNTTWSNPNNWQSGVAPTGTPAAHDDLVFGSLANQRTSTNDIAGGTFNSISISASNYTLKGAGITLGDSSLVGSGFIIVNSGAQANFINFNIQMGGVAGDQQFFTVNFGGELTINGVLSSPPSVQSPELTKDGAGILTLTADNSPFTGTIEINPNGGILQITNANALGSFGGATDYTRVGTNGQLQVKNVAGVINEVVILNGPGIANDGALQNVSGNNIWQGSVVLDSNASLGSIAGFLNITGVLSDTGAGHDVTKEGIGQIILSNANTYRGLMTVNNGILTIRNPFALGFGDRTMASGTLVTSGPSHSGTLQIEDTTGVGFTVKDERLTLNGYGFTPLLPAGSPALGALDNLKGDNTWADGVTLGSPPNVGRDVSIGAELSGGLPTNLTISGVVDDINGIFTLNKVGPGRVILNNDNTYRGFTDVRVGYLSIRDSHGLGPDASSSTEVEVDASLELEVDAGLDAYGRNLAVDSVTGDDIHMIITEDLTINGSGVANSGALHSKSGINEWINAITLGINGGPAAPGPTPKQASGDAIGVDIDSRPGHPLANNNYFTDDYSLRITGLIQDVNPPSLDPSDLHKVGTGHLILPNANSTYRGQTFIEQGWITIQNGQSLGSKTPQITDTLQPKIYVWSGAALHLKPLVPGTDITLDRSLVLEGIGPAHPFGGPDGIGQKGALMNLGGNNLITGDIQLNHNAGIGVALPDIAYPVSELTLTGKMSDFKSFTVIGRQFVGSSREDVNYINTGATGGQLQITYDFRDFSLFTGRPLIPNWPDQLDVFYGPRFAGGSNIFATGVVSTVATGPVTSGLISYGPGASKLVEVAVNRGGGIFGTGWKYTVNVFPSGAGTGGITKFGSRRLNIEGDGTYTGAVDIAEGVLRAQNSTAFGAASGGTTVEAGAALEMGPVNPLNHGGVGASSTINAGGVVVGIQVFGEQLTLKGSGNVLTGDGTITNVNGLNLFNDPLSADNMWRGPITLNTDAVIDVRDGTRLTLFGAIGDTVASGLTKVGLGELVLSGASTYRGTTFLNAGVTTIENSTALGSPAGGTIVANGAQIQLQGSITVAGESLTIQGSGSAAVPTVPQEWLPIGPAPINNGQTIGNQPVTGRVTGIATDPQDSNVIYITSAGGGAWKTKDNGLSWLPLIDNAVDPATGNQIPIQGIYAGAIAISPTDPNVLYIGLGEANNSGDSYYGRGILKSTDYGITWTLIQPPGPAFDLRSITKIVVDPVNPDIIYTAVNGDGSPTYSLPGSGGIWKYDPSQGTPWTNLTLGKSPVDPFLSDGIITFSSFDQYTDLAVIEDPRDVGSPNPNHIVVFCLGNPAGQPFPVGGINPVGNGVYTSIDDGATWNLYLFVTADPAPVFGPNMQFTHGGVSKLSVHVTPFYNLDGTRAQTGRITIDVSEEYPLGYPPPPFNTLNGMFRDIAQLTMDWSLPTFPLFPPIWSYPAPPPNNSGSPNGYLGTQGDYNQVIAVDPNNVNNILLFGIGEPFTLGPYLSTDNAQTWTDIGFADISGNAPHADYHAYSWDANDHVIVGNDGGVWRLDNLTPGQIHWTDLNGNLAITEFNGISSHPTNPDISYGGSQDNGTEIFSGSQGWTHVDDGDGGQIHVDPKDPNYVYHVLNGDLYRSTAGGAVNTWNLILPNVATNLYFPFLVDSINHSRVLAGGDIFPSLKESVDQGNTFVSLNAPIAVTSLAAAVYQGTFQADPGFPTVTDKGANTYDPDTIYITGTVTFRVTKTHGSNWVTRTPPGTGPIMDLEVDAANRDTVYIVRGDFNGTPGAGKVYKSTNAGQTWTDISFGLPDLPCYKLVVNPRTSDLYLGNDDGVWQLANGSPTWKRFGAGMPSVQVTDLELNQNLNTLTAGTYGRSAFQLFLDNTMPSSGAIRAVSGSSVWTGPVILTGDTLIRAEGPQSLPNGVSIASLNIVGTISDDVPGANHKITKFGAGDVIFSGTNTYGGITEVQEGNLVVHNRQALGGSYIQTGSTQSGTAVVTGLTNTATLLVGMAVTGAGIPQNATILSIDSPTQITLSLPATQTATVPLTFLAPTIVDNGAALVLQTDLELEPVHLNGNGIPLNGHDTGSLRNISNNNTYTGTLTLLSNATIGVDSASTLTIGTKAGLLGTGTIDDAGNSFSITKELTGTLILNSANTYDGGTVVNQGILNIQHPNALGSNSATVLDGAQLQVQAVSPVTGISVANNLRLSGTGIFNSGALQNVTGINHWTGTISLALDAGFSPLTFPPLNVAIGAANTGENNRLIIDGQIVEVPAGMGITKVGPGIVVLNNNGNTYNGLTTVFAGTLRIEQGGALGGFGAAANGTVVNAGAVLEIDGDPTHLGGGTGINVPAELLTLNGTGIASTGALRNITGINTWAGDVILQTNTSIGVDTDNAVPPLPSPLATNLTITGIVKDPPPPITKTASTLTKVGTGKLVFTGANTYGGDTFINVGILDDANNTGLGMDSPEVQTVNITGTTGSFQLIFTPIGGSAQTTAVIPNNNNGDYTAALDAALEALPGIGVGGVTVTRLTTSTIYEIKFDGPNLIGKNQNLLSKTTSGGTVVAILPVADGAGATTVASGATLQLEGNITVSGETLTINGTGVNNAGALENFSGSNFWTTRPITLGSTSNIGVDQPFDVLTLDTAIIGSGGVTKVGPGTLVYFGNASNTYTGLTTVNDGTLQLNKGAGFTAVPQNLNVGDGIGVAGSAIVQLLASNQIADSSDVTVKSDGLFDVNGQSETIDPLVITDGQVTSGAGGLLTVTSLTMTGGTINLVTAPSQLILNGAAANVTAISDALGSAVIMGAGTLSLNGTTRTFTVNDGPKSSDLIVSAVIGGTGAEGLTKAGLGRLQLDGANTYTGTTTINAGDVEVNGTVGNVLISGGSLSGGNAAGTSGFTGAVTVGPAASTVSPGDNGLASPAGILHTSTETWAANTTFFVNLDNSNSPGAPTVGVDYDQLNVAGTITLNGAALAGTVGAGVGIGDSYTIIQTSGGVSGRFAEPFGAGIAYIAGQKFTVDYSSGTSVVLNRVPINTTTTLTSNPLGFTSVFGQSVTFTADVNLEAGASGAFPLTDKVRFVLDGSALLTVDKFVDANGIATFNPLTDLAPGVTMSVGLHTISATFLGDTQRNTSSDLETQTVNKASTSIGVTSNPPNAPTTPAFGQPVTVTATVSASSPGTGVPAGTATFTVDGVPGAPIGLDPAGKASTILSNLSAGTHLIKVDYSGNGNYNSSSTTYNVIVQKDSSAVAVSSNPASPPGSVFGQPVDFTATVSAVGGSGTPSGTVVFYDGPVGGIIIGTASLDPSGVGTITVSSLSAAVHNISVAYGGDINFKSNTGILNNFTVSAAGTSTGISTSLTPSAFGQPVTFTANVTTLLPGAGTAAGTVGFFIDGILKGTKTLNGSAVATFTISNITIGSHSVVATYNGNTSFATSSSAPLTQDVSGATATTLKSSLNPSALTQNVTFTATVKANGIAVASAGTVTFFVNGVDASGPVAVDASGQAVFSTTTLPGGTDVIKAVYSGSALYGASTSANLSQVVTKISSSTVVTTSQTPAPFGTSVTFTATVSGSSTPTGSVTFFVDGVNKGSAPLDAFGVASLPLTTIPVGTHTVKALYNGDNSFKTSFGTVSQQITKIGTSTNLVSLSNPSFRNQPVTFSALVTSATATPTGKVNFYVNNVFKAQGTLDASGIATATISSIPVGANNTVKAVYVGNANLGSSSDSIIQVVQAPGTTPSTTTVATSGTPSFFGQSVTFTATVAGAPTPGGSVSFFVDGVRKATVALDGAGQATFTTTTLAVGNRKITVSYYGDTTYAPSKTATALIQSVQKSATSTALGLSNDPSVVGEPVVFTATVTNTTSPSPVTGRVYFYVDNVLKGSALVNASGQASLTVNSMKVGAHTIKAVYAGSANLATSNTTTPQTVNPVGTAASTIGLVSDGSPSVAGAPVTFTATVSGLLGTPTGTVGFFVDGIRKATVVLDGSGQATFTTSKLASGNRKITVTYYGDTVYAKKTSAILIQTVTGSSSGAATHLIASWTSSILTVTALTATGSQATSFTDPVSVSLVSGPGTLTGLTSGVFNGGVVRLNPFTVSNAGLYTIRITTASGLTLFYTFSTSGRQT